MQRTVESVAQFGVLAPLIARPRPEGGYEIISGHRRQHAAELAGLKTLPVIVRNMDDDQAVIQMVDSNLQRESILPSERAFAYKMKLEAIKNQGARSDLTSDQLGQKLPWAVERVANDSDVSKTQVQRFIRLTNLIPELLELVDQKKISFNPAVELSYLTDSEQRDFFEAMQDTQNAPSLSQAQRIKKLSQAGQCSYDAIFDIMGEEKKAEMDRVTIKNEVLRKYFPKSYTPKQMQDTIIKLLETGGRSMYEQKMDSTFSEELEAMEALEAYVSRLFFYDVHDLDCAAPQQENGYLVVTGPDTPLSIIRMENAQDYHPDFQRADVLFGLPDMPIMMSYSPGKVSCVAGKRYLIGPMVFFRLGKELSVASLSLGDLQYVLKFLNSHQKFITVDGEILQVICLD